MRLHVPARRLLPALFLVCLAFVTTLRAQPAATPAPKAQQPADVRAYRAAVKIDDPAQQAAAFEQFLSDYPKSSSAGRARTALLKVLLKSFPERADRIDELARIVVKKTPKDYRGREEASVAMQLTDAGTNGVDIKRAESFSQDALKRAQESKLNADFAAMAKKYGEPYTPAEMRTYYAEIRCEALAARAGVKLAQGKLDEAAALLHEADTLNPHVDDIKAVEGRLALRRGNKAEALDDFQEAELLGSLSRPWRDKAAELYRQAHGGSDAQWTADMDARYAKLNPEPFAPGTHPVPPAGHTVLLELFTGSGCEPCVGGDLAVDGILQSYPRSEVVALAFDQHIPRPDPLSIPEGVERAGVYSIRGTPSYTIDGAMTTVSGARGNGSEKLYKQLTALLDQQAAAPSSVQLQLAATAGLDGSVQAQAMVIAAPGDAVSQQIGRRIAVDPPSEPNAPKPPPPAKAKASKAVTLAAKAPALPAAPALPPGPALEVRFALVEDNVRYSGENGIRFHRMVVRSLAKPGAESFAVTPGATSTLHASFQPAEISKALTEYLDSYEKSNERFGKIDFLSKDTSMEPSHLAVAAWVQDTNTHRVLQAAFVSLAGGGTGSGGQ